MAADYQNFGYGAVQFPLTTSLANTLLQDADPAVATTLAYFQSVLTTHMGARLIAQAQAGVTTQNQAPITGAIASTISFDPAPYLQEAQFAFPLLAVYRINAEYEDRTVTWPHEMATWGVQYVLPPLSPGQLRQLGPILSAVPKILHNRIENMFDPSYSSGLKVWAAAGIESMHLRTGARGRYESGGNLVFPMWSGTLLVKERVSTATSSFGALTGIDYAEDLASRLDPTVLDVVDGKVSFDPASTVSNLCLWLTGDTSVTNALDGFHVSSWGDQSSAANAAVQATAANQPIDMPGVAIDAAGTARPVIRFDATALTYLQAPASQLAQDTGKTLIVLARVANQTARQTIMCQTLAADTGAKTFGIEANTLSGVGGRMGIIAGGSAFDTATPVDTQWHVYTLRTSATTNAGSITGTTNLRIDGARQTLTLKSGTGLWTGMATSNIVSLGGIPAALSTTAFSGDIAIAFAVNANITDSDAATLEAVCRRYVGP